MEITKQSAIYEYLGSDGKWHELPGAEIAVELTPDGRHIIILNKVTEVRETAEWRNSRHADVQRTQDQK